MSLKKGIAVGIGALLGGGAGFLASRQIHEAIQDKYRKKNRRRS